MERSILPPCIITARLMEGVEIAGAYLSIEAVNCTAEGRVRYRWFLDLPDGSEHSDDDLCSGCGLAQDERGSLATLLVFLGACAESRRYGGGENADLFSEEVGAWAEANSDEIGMLAFEIEHSEEA